MQDVKERRAKASKYLNDPAYKKQVHFKVAFTHSKGCPPAPFDTHKRLCVPPLPCCVQCDEENRAKFLAKKAAEPEEPKGFAFIVPLAPFGQS